MRRACLLLLFGAMVGGLNNLLAGPTRYLQWIGEYPDKRSRSVETSIVSEAAPPRPAETDPVEPAFEDVVIPEVDPDRAYVEVGSAEVRALHAQGAIFVDARRTSQYDAGHIAGAHSIAIWEAGVDEKISDLAFVTGGDPETPVVVYCNGGDCEDSHMLAEKLWLQDFWHVLVYTEGYPDWIAAGGQVDTVGGSS